VTSDRVCVGCLLPVSITRKADSAWRSPNTVRIVEQYGELAVVTD